jgi:hypothetical protein
LEDDGWTDHDIAAGQPSAVVEGGEDGLRALRTAGIEVDLLVAYVRCFGVDAAGWTLAKLRLRRPAHGLEPHGDDLDRLTLAGVRETVVVGGVEGLRQTRNVEREI